MTASLLPNDAQKVVSRIDTHLSRVINQMKTAVSEIESLLTKSTTGGGNKTPIPRDDILDAGGDRYASLLDFLAKTKDAINVAAPGSYVDTPPTA